MLSNFRELLKGLDHNQLWFLAEGYFNSSEVKRIIAEELSVPEYGKYIIGEMMARGIWDKFRKAHAHIFYPLCPSCYARYL